MGYFLASCILPMARCTMAADGIMYDGKMARCRWHDTNGMIQYRWHDGTMADGTMAIRTMARCRWHDGYRSSTAAKDSLTRWHDARWHDGSMPMARWHDGAMARLHDGMMPRWHDADATMARWHDGSPIAPIHDADGSKSFRNNPTATV